MMISRECCRNTESMLEGSLFELWSCRWLRTNELTQIHTNLCDVECQLSCIQYSELYTFLMYLLACIRHDIQAKSTVDLLWQSTGALTLGIYLYIYIVQTQCMHFTLTYTVPTSWIPEDLHFRPNGGHCDCVSVNAFSISVFRGNVVLYVCWHLLVLMTYLRNNWRLMDIVLILKALY